ncbi:MAG: hypothetical protein K2H64_08885, partial [Desulfovibrio sp.]|nr:hypothetical protein [Desulfovibrio sp.]
MAAIFSSISDKREINYPLIYTDIMFSTYFRECKSINETSIKGLIRVNTLNYVELDDKISIIKIEINIHKYNISYDDLLESSINETKNFYRSLKDSLPGYNYVFELTGGKDSRMNISPFI